MYLITCISFYSDRARLVPGMCFRWQSLQILDLLDQEQEEEIPLQDTAFQRSSLPRNTEIYQTHKHYGIILQNSIYHIILSPSHCASRSQYPALETVLKIFNPLVYLSHGKCNVVKRDYLCGISRVKEVEKLSNLSIA